MSILFEIIGICCILAVLGVGVRAVFHSWNARYLFNKQKREDQDSDLYTEETVEEIPQPKPPAKVNNRKIVR